MMRTLLNPFTFVDPKRESRESEPDHSELPDRVPEETELKVKRRRLSAPRGVGGARAEGLAERIFSTCLATSTAAAVADVAPVCFSQYHFLFFFNSGASVIRTSCFSSITFFSFFWGSFALDCQPRCRGFLTHRQAQRMASRTMRKAEPEEIPTMAAIPER